MSYFKHIKQDVETAFVSTDDINASSTYTSDTFETLGINSIQVFCHTDQNCTLYVDQGLDGTNWDITDELSTLADVTISRIIYSVAPYFRVRVTNLSTTTTASDVRIAAGMTPVINPLPRALTDDQRLKCEGTISGRENTERHVWVNPTNELAISPVYRMVGTNFDGDTKDTNFWTDGSLRDGTVTQDGGEIELETNTTANGLALYQSVRKARFVAGSAQLMSGAANWVTAGTADNLRRVGAYTLDVDLDPDDGFFFQLSGTTFSVGYSRAESVTLVNSGSFNGNYGSTWSPTADTYYRITIEFTPMGALWYINGTLLHKIGMAHMSDFMTLPITIENENTGDSTTEVVFDSVGLYIARQGELQTNPTSKRVSGTSETQFKYGAGTLKGAIISAVANGADINIYDGTSTGDTLIWASGNLASKTEPFNIDFYGLPFSDGLFLEIDDSNADVVLVYE